MENPMFEVRKIVTKVEEIYHDGGPKKDKPARKAAVMVVVKNPFAGKYVEDIAGAMDTLKPLGLEMSKRLIDALGGDASIIEGYGKGAIVGQAGELEHGALWHVPGGYSMRELISESKAIVPSSKKVGGVGCAIDIPITHTNACYVRSHFDAMEVNVPDAPKSDEIVFVLVMAVGGRVHSRLGGLTVEQVKGEDGLR